ncbi:MAG: DUF4065 domain-containing protein [Eubacteriaceae bacterium]|nr:DUF4065 domain-containing protein [Eubacteriaceae bacterium]
MKRTNVYDISNWFLTKQAMGPKKLQILVFYAYAWEYALFDYPISKECEFQAWAHGPVCPALYHKYKSYTWTKIQRRPSANAYFIGKEQDVLDAVWEIYGRMNEEELSELARSEPPWFNARAGCDPRENCSTQISEEDMRTFYIKVIPNLLRMNEWAGPVMKWWAEKQVLTASGH